MSSSTCKAITKKGLVCRRAVQDCVLPFESPKGLCGIHLNLNPEFKIAQAEYIQRCHRQNEEQRLHDEIISSASLLEEERQRNADIYTRVEEVVDLLTIYFNTLPTSPTEEDGNVPLTFPSSIPIEKVCTICNEQNLIYLKLGCEHTICDGCLRGLVNKLCPVCRETINMKLVKKIV